MGLGELGLRLFYIEPRRVGEPGGGVLVADLALATAATTAVTGWLYLAGTTPSVSRSAVVTAVPVVAASALASQLGCIALFDVHGSSLVYHALAGAGAWLCPLAGCTVAGPGSGSPPAVAAVGLTALTLAAVNLRCKWWWLVGVVGLDLPLSPACHFPPSGHLPPLLHSHP